MQQTLLIDQQVVAAGLTLLLSRVVAVLVRQLAHHFSDLVQVQNICNKLRVSAKSKELAWFGHATRHDGLSNKPSFGASWRVGHDVVGSL